jgi:hypothetical protein
MRLALTLGLLLLAAMPTAAQQSPNASADRERGIIPPKTVRVVRQTVEGTTKYVTVANDEGHYWLVFANLMPPIVSNAGFAPVNRPVEYRPPAPGSK